MTDRARARPEAIPVSKPASDYRVELARLSAENAALRLSIARHSTAEARLSLALESTGFGVWDWDMKSGDVWMSNSALSVQGYLPGEVETRMLDAEAYFHPQDWPHWKKLLTLCVKGRLDLIANEHRLRHKDGGWVWILERARIVERDEAGRAVRMIGTRADVTERRESEERVRWLAVHDPLTGLLNRALFEEMLSAAIHSSNKEGGRAGLLFIDIDDFKAINDENGHEAGDGALCRIADHLRGLFPPPATVARIGGDEFGVVLPKVRSMAGLKALAKSALRKPDAGVPSISIGAALYPDLATSARDLRRKADVALYRAKAAGKSRAVVYDGA
mgnify:CR=1 FL=1